MLLSLWKWYIHGVHVFVQWTWLIYSYSKTCLQGTLATRGHPVVKGHFLKTVSYLPHVKEPVKKGHLSCRDTFSWILRCPLKTGFTVLIISTKINISISYFTALSLFSYLPRHAKYSFYGNIWIFVFLHNAIFGQASDQSTCLNKICTCPPGKYGTRLSMTQILSNISSVLKWI